MHTFDTRRNQSSGTDATLRPLERPFDAGIFGIDNAGRAHRYSRTRNTVYVTAGRDLVRVERLDAHDRDVDDWITFVREELGWRDRWFHGHSGVTATQARLQAAREGSR